MTETMYQAYGQRSAAFARGFETMERSLQYWCLEHTPSRDVMRSLCRLDANSGCEYPPLWFTHQAETYAYATVLCDAQTIRQWAKGEKRLDPMAQEMVATWTESPAIWCYFTILEVKANDFFTISDRLTGASLTLYSPALSCLVQDTQNLTKHFVALIATNGMCMQSFGMIHSNNLGASDLDFFCTMLDQQAYMTSGFSRVVNSHFIDFLGIDAVTHVPTMTHEGIWLKQTFNKVTFDTFDPAMLDDAWETERKGSYAASTLVRRSPALAASGASDAFWEDVPFSRPTLFLDLRSKSGWLHTLGRSSYNEFIKVIRFLFPMIPMDKVIVPDYVVSPSMVHLMEMQKRKCPWSDCTEPFDQNESLNNEAAQVERIVSDHVRSLGTPPLFLRGTSTIKDPNGLTMGKGPVRVGMRLESPLEDSPLFSVTMDAHLTAVVTAWKAMLASDAQVTLNLFFQLLWYHAGCFKETDAYAAELSKQLPFLLKRHPAFPADFHSFCLDTMQKEGLLLVQGTTIRPSLAFAKSVIWK
ncbi:MAG: hypothetical protein LKE28_02000 [Sphaerochaeta sp.]|nr:hypothetical protein [Sphaerochaeta sp.]